MNKKQEIDQEKRKKNISLLISLAILLIYLLGYYVITIQLIKLSYYIGYSQGKLDMLRYVLDHLPC